MNSYYWKKKWVLATLQSPRLWQFRLPPRRRSHPPKFEVSLNLTEPPSNSEAPNPFPLQEKQPHLKFSALPICLQLLRGFLFHCYAVFSLFLLPSTFSHPLSMTFRLGESLTVKDLNAVLYHFKSSNKFNHISQVPPSSSAYV